MEPTNDEQTQLLREIWKQLKTVDRTLDARIDGLGDRLDARIDGLGDRLDARIDALGDRLDARIDALGSELGARIDETNRELRTFRVWTQENFTRVQGNFDLLKARPASRRSTRGSSASSAAPG